MRRAGHLFDAIVDRGNLQWAFWKASKGKPASRAVRAFAADLDGNLFRMARGLQDGTLELGRFDQSVIYDPKQRIITAPWFDERVLHHAIINVCEPVFERWLIRDTYACLRGRGREAAIARARCFSAREGFFLNTDIRSYFDCVSHDVLVSRLQQLFKDRRLLVLLERIVRSFRGSSGRGLPIGSLMSQHFANFYLGWFDRFVKETLRVRGYVRYMDDSLLWGSSAASLRETLGRCRTYLDEELLLSFKAEPYINRTAHGVDFLGCRVFPDHVVLNRRSRRRFAGKMRDLEQGYLDGEVGDDELQARSTSLVAFTMAAGARSWHFRRAVLEQCPVSGRRPRTG
jgi:hypothetical protein